MKYRRGWIALVIMAVLSPLGLLAIGSAWGEWDLAAIGDLVGFMPEGMRKWEGFQPEAPLKDYEVPGLRSSRWGLGLGTVLSAFLGAGLTAGATILIGRLTRHARLP